MPSTILALVTELSASLGVPTERSLSFVASILPASLAAVMAPSAIFAVVMVPSAILAPRTALSANFVDETAASASWLEATAPLATIAVVIEPPATDSATFARKAKAVVTICWRGDISGSTAAVPSSTVMPR